MPTQRWVRRLMDGGLVAQVRSCRAVRERRWCVEFLPIRLDRHTVHSRLPILCAVGDCKARWLYRHLAGRLIWRQRRRTAVWVCAGNSRSCRLTVAGCCVKEMEPLSICKISVRVASAEVESRRISLRKRFDVKCNWKLYGRHTGCFSGKRKPEFRLRQEIVIHVMMFILSPPLSTVTTYNKPFILSGSIAWLFHRENCMSKSTTLLTSSGV